MTIRDSFEVISPPWLTKRVAKRIGWTIGLALDGYRELVREGVKARMPGVGSADALPLIGADRQIERGPTESEESYAARLSGAFDTWRVMGNPRPLLEQLRAYFLPSPPPIRIVSDRAVWHEIDPTTAAVTRTRTSPVNWIWDTYSAGPTPRWWRGWVVIDSSAGPWSQWLIGEPGVLLGDGHTIGSTATVEEIESIRRIVRRCKPANVHVMNVCVTFDATLFRASNAPGGSMPNGNFDDYANRPTDAAYWEGVI